MERNENYREIDKNFSLFCFYDDIPSSSTRSTRKYNVNVFVDKNKNLDEFLVSSNEKQVKTDISKIDNRKSWSM